MAGCAWVASTAILQIRFYVMDDPFPGSIELTRVFLWTQALSSIAYPVFLVAVGAYVLQWLRRHGAVEADRSDGLPHAGNTPG